MATRKFKVDGPSGSIAIIKASADELAVTNPGDYLSDNFFNSNLNYSAITAKAFALQLDFSGIARNYTEWDDGDKCCFITTACVKYNNHADNDEVLNTLRKFRDSYMRNSAELAKLVDQYYLTAPTIVQKLDSRADAEAVYNKLYSLYILPAVECIKQNKNIEALSFYTKLYSEAKTISETK